jgi:hypothetical protein
MTHTEFPFKNGQNVWSIFRQDRHSQHQCGAVIDRRPGSVKVRHSNDPISGARWIDNDFLVAVDINVGGGLPAGRIWPCESSR